MIHRGPDGGGQFDDDEISLGVRRLSIIDLDTGDQPIHNEDKSVWIVFNGEIYNFIELRRQLEARGHRFYTKTDTETIIHLYEEYGQKCVDHLRGMFAFAIWDCKQRLLLLARDRLGIKPLLYCVVDERIVFGSELKVLLASGLIPRELDPLAVEHYLTFLAAPHPRTMIKGVYALPAGCTLVAQDGKRRIEHYWDIPWQAEFEKDCPDDEYLSRFKALLAEACEYRLVSDVPLGVFLSGGVDSSLIVAIMSRLLDYPVKTFNISFGREGEKFNETTYARAIAGRFKTEHTEAVVTAQDVLNDLDEIIWALDQPSHDGVNTYFVSRLAKSSVTVALSGLGGDELFGGYPFFNFYSQLRRYGELWRRLPGGLRKWVGGGLGAGGSAPTGVQNLKRRLRNLDNLCEVPLSEVYTLSRGFSSQGVGLSITTPVFRQALEASARDDGNDTFLHSIAGQVEGGLPFNQAAHMELNVYMHNTLLRDTDAVSMAHSLEVRVPLLDHKLVEFAAGTPPRLKQNKWLIKKLAYEFLPPEVIDRPKRGFMFPYSVWLRGELKPVLDSAFDQETVARRGIFDYPTVARLYHRFLADPEVDYIGVWGLAVLELWCRKFID